MKDEDKALLWKSMSKDMRLAILGNIKNVKELIDRFDLAVDKKSE
jgi:hypothetical protein